MCAKIERRTENGRVRNTASADAIRSLQHDEAPVGSEDTPCGSNTRCAGADNRHVHVRRGLRAQQCRHRDDSRGSSEEQTSAWSRHGIQTLG
jgi:hypothetical protein